MNESGRQRNDSLTSNEQSAQPEAPHGTSKPPRLFWLVAGLALVWNLLGLMAFIGQLGMSAEQVAQMPPEQRRLYENMPAWATTGFGIAVIGGTLGSMGLLLRRRWALPLFIFSFIGIIVQDAYFFLVAKAWKVVGVEAWIMTAMVLAIAVALIVFASQSRRSGWIR